MSNMPTGSTSGGCFTRSETFQSGCRRARINGAAIPNKKARHRRAFFVASRASGSDRVLLLDRLAQLLHRRGLDLADALGRDAVLVAQLLQAGLVAVAEPAALQDVARALVQARQGVVHARLAPLVPVLALQFAARV